jgi:tetratricopeptide (TPR) repeat protein
LAHIKKEKTMKFLTAFILSILLVSCQSDLKKKESDEAYKKGIETLERLSENGDPDYNEALKHLSLATDLNPNNINAQFWKADAELKLNEFNLSYNTAITALDKTDSEHHLRPNFLVIAGLSAKELGKNGDTYFSEAIIIYENRLKRNNNDIVAIMDKAIVLSYMDKKNEAIDFLNTLTLNEENQAFLEQIKANIRTFDADENAY